MRLYAGDFLFFCKLHFLIIKKLRKNFIFLIISQLLCIFSLIFLYTYTKIIQEKENILYVYINIYFMYCNTYFIYI